MLDRPRFSAFSAVSRRFLISGLAAAALGACTLIEPEPTRPIPLPASLTRIAVGSCADQTLPQPIWDAVLAVKPELFVFMGDNVYGDVKSPDLKELRAAYEAAGGITGYRRLRSTVSVLPIWDDHDYGVNDGGADFPYRAQSKELFLDFWGIPADDVRRARPGLYHAEIIGPPGQRVQIILLDTRWFRSPLKQTEQRRPGRGRYVADPDPSKTMLGDEQWAWLAEQLRQPAELRLVVSSVQVLAEDHGFERWGNFPRERDRLLSLIAETGASGVVFLSGDRHIGAFYRQVRGAPYPLYEMTSSSLNRPFRGASEVDIRRIGPLFDQENFGTVAIDWEAQTVTLALHDITGAKFGGHTVSLSLLKPRTH
jgi:alkaline phosphatase D